MCWDGTGASLRTRRPAFPLGSARDRCSDSEKRVLLWLLGLPSRLSLGPPCGLLFTALPFFCCCSYSAGGSSLQVLSLCHPHPLTCFLPDVCLVCLFMLASCHSPTHSPQMVRKVGLLT